MHQTTHATRAAAALAAATLAHAAPAEPEPPDAGGEPWPQAVLSNAGLRVTVYLPDATNGFYRGPRFDWSGMLAQAHWNGHTFFAELKHPHDPTAHDHGCGPAEEFGIGGALGFGIPNEDLTFVKIGVGHLATQGARYFFGTNYRVARPAPWHVTQAVDRIAFRQDLADTRGWGYRYEKTVRLQADPPAILVWHRLANTGTQPIRTDHYSHNIVAIDGHPAGNGYTLAFPFAARAEGKGNPAVAIEDRRLRFLPEALTNAVYLPLQGFGTNAADNAVIVRHAAAGASLRLSTDAPLARFAVYAERSAVCPEPFVALDLAPGAAFEWTTTLAFGH